MLHPPSPPALPLVKVKAEMGISMVAREQKSVSVTVLVTNTCKYYVHFTLKYLISTLPGINFLFSKFREQLFGSLNEILNKAPFFNPNDRDGMNVVITL